MCLRRSSLGPDLPIATQAVGASRLRPGRAGVENLRRTVVRRRAWVRKGCVRAQPGLVVALIVAALVATGCSSHRDQSATSTTATTAASATSTTLSPVEQGIVAAYRRYWEVYIAVGSEMKLPDPRLAEVATGDELRQLGGAFLAYKVEGEVFRGTIDLAPKVLAVSGDTATVSDCYASHIIGYDAATGQPKGPGRPGRTLVTVTMVREANTWKVAAIRHEGDGCTPAP